MSSHRLYPSVARPSQRFRVLSFVVALLATPWLASCGGSPYSRPEPVELLAAGTPYETPLFSLKGPDPGATVLVIGGVHGDEPGGSRAAERLLTAYRPATGELLVLPRANAIAVEEGVRSREDLGDLNRLYGATDYALPMASIAAEVVRVVRDYGVDVVLDLHESWQPFTEASVRNDGSSVDTGHIGQTVAGHAGERSRSLAKALVARVNRGLESNEDFTYLEYPEDYEEQTIVPVPPNLPAGAMPNKSSMEIARLVPGVASITSEVSQQQSMKRRVEQQIALVKALIALAAG